MRRKASSLVIAYAAHATSLVLTRSRFNRVHRPIANHRDYDRIKFMNRLEYDDDCRSMLRMGIEVFRALVHLLRDTNRLQDTWSTSVEEQVAQFLYLIGQNARNRNVKFTFFRSGETISRHFHEVLKAIISLHEIFLRPPEGSECPP